MKAESIIYHNSKRAEILIVVFGIFIAISLVGILSSLLELKLLQDINNGMYISEEQANSNDIRQQIMAIVGIMAFIATAVVFLNWFRRAYGNLHRLGDKTLRHSESLAVWSFIIPIVCYFWPLQIMNDIWDRTQYHIKNVDKNYKMRKDKFLIGIWWTLFVISVLVGNILFRTIFKDETLEEMIVSSQAMIISDVLQIIEAIVVILIVKRVSEMEKQLKTTHDSTVNAIITQEEE